jgi:hypothetical protein
LKQSLTAIEEVVKKANSKNHQLVGGDFAYTKLIEYYEGKDNKKYAYYRNLHKNFINES